MMFEMCRDEETVELAEEMKPANVPSPEISKVPEIVEDAPAEINPFSNMASPPSVSVEEAERWS